MLPAILRRHVLAVHKGWNLSTFQQRSCVSIFASARELDDGSRSLQVCSWPARFLRRQTYAVAGLLRAHTFHSSALRFKRRKKPEPPPQEDHYEIRDFVNSPKPAMILGLSGLIPFVTPPLVMAMTGTYLPELAFVQVAYGASILAFLGGARWGFAMPESSPAKPDWINLSNSVVPSLAAWLAMMFLMFCGKITPAGTMVIVGLGVSLHYDLGLLPTYPRWFKSLRAILTVVAFVSLLVTINLNGLLPEKRLFSDK